MIENKRVQWLVVICMAMLWCQIYALNDLTPYTITFDQSMRFRNEKHYKKCINSSAHRFIGGAKDADEFIKTARALYEKNNLAVTEPQLKTKIPKIIHQIWLGSPLPDVYKKWQASWLKLNPDWEYILWTDDTIKGLELYNKDYFDKAINWGEKANILRYEILYQFGGVYADMDFECLKSFDVLAHTYDFFCGISGIDQHCFLFINNAIIGSVPGHSILKHCIEHIRIDKQNEKELRKITRLTNATTGPIRFTKSFYMQAPYSEGVVIAFPSTFLYPIGYGERNINSTDLNNRLKSMPEAFAIHYWASHWMDKVKP